MSRPDSYILLLSSLKKAIEIQKQHCSQTLVDLETIQLDVNYDEAATTLEKSNIDSLISLISNGLQALQSIVWE